MLNKEIEKAEVNKDKAKKLLREYEKASPEIKEKVRKGEIDISNVELETASKENKDKYEEATKSKDEGLKIIRTAEIIQNVREEIINTTRELDKFFYKIKAVRFAKLSWKNKTEQKDFKVFVNDALKKAQFWVKTLERIKEEVENE
jgi:hypothetical protein